ncbi:general transcription factor IIF subunit 2 [Diaphorina citri]|uniref:General transcription factor IIF subunit 2 n=1 Tax=Diaphorina citri TaxID=121845 RepID=A0A1S3D928_DIACI|nr:general transcription factor IIF subunit 2 [Diaphorina citri]
MTTSSQHADKDLDLTQASRGVWLVKVPKYVANKWEKVPGNIEAGKLKIVRNPGQKPVVSLSLSEATMCVDPNEEKIPKDHRLDVQIVNRQTLGVFSHYIPPVNPDAIVPESEKLMLEGKIVQKLECRPYADSCYMKLKLDSIIKASQPLRQVKHLDKIVQNYKPVSNHKHLVALASAACVTDCVRTQQGPFLLGDCLHQEHWNLENILASMMATKFQHKQLFNVLPAREITNVYTNTYLKEILKEVCNYNLKNPHKNMWELKPEYRCYKEEEKKEEATADDDDD